MSIEIFQSSRSKKELKVLFISKRDSCRAPIADTIFNHLADKYSNRNFNKFIWRSSSAGLEVPQASQGKLPDQKTLRVINENHLETMHGCRQIKMFDFSRHDYILYMEPSQLEPLLEMAPIDKKSRLHMLGDFIQGREKNIEDPFYDDMNTFRICFERLYVACENFFFHVNEKRLC
ncbi:unnamed protein product [Chironomus riparius]|uniref:acid phosphatase n=1 Tax=Chironomus riparius TaxID=315576 RepID=A0A9N9RHR8_9DIPT|nr:unnamed protein product [Chironomus riparius]